jgi:hypothetical protein
MVQGQQNINSCISPDTNCTTTAAMTVQGLAGRADASVLPHSSSLESHKLRHLSSPP